MIAGPTVVQRWARPTRECLSFCHNRPVGGVPQERVAIVGQGYVGLGLAMRAVEVGHHVVGFDVDELRVRLLEGGCSYVEDVASEPHAGALALSTCSVTRPASASGLVVVTASWPCRPSSTQ
jgi:UDP-N-acetyl-D-mannosaminuronate dehydrogenase